MAAHGADLSMTTTAIAQCPTIRLDRGAGPAPPAAYRREVKFLLHGADRRKIADVLSGNARLVRFGRHESSRVHSIYFDDTYLSSARESLAGVGRRVKTRLRWYDQPLASSRAFFEVKARRGISMSKRRFPITLDRPLGEIPFHRLVNGLLAVLPDDAGALLAARPEPTVLVSYRRLHFVDPDSATRMTVDWDVQGFDQTGLQVPGARFGAPWHDATIVEVKTPIDREGDVCRVLYPLRFRLTRSSKYVQCCSRLGWGTVDEQRD
jgi:hypothetical protein